MANLFSLPFLVTMVRALLVIILLAFHFSVSAQVPAWQSARAVAVATATANSSSQVTATAIDAAGNVYLAGNFTGAVVLGGTTLTSLGYYDVFVTKFDPVSNQFVWAQRAGGMGDDRVDALALSGTNVYVAGYFGSPTAAFGSTTLINSGGSTGATDVFVAKLTAAGSFAWSQRAGGSGPDYATALAVNGPSVYVAGHFDGSVASFGAIALTSAGLSDIFVAKLADAGSTSSFVWAQRAGGTWGDYAAALAVSGASVYVAGGFGSAAVAFGSAILTSTNPNANLNDIYVAKLTDAGSTGSFVWAQRAGGTGSDGASTLVVNGTSVYMAGTFGSPIAGFGAAVLANADASTGTPDAFVAKLTDAGSTGSFVWAQRAGGTYYEEANALAVNGNSVYIAGMFGSTMADFGPVTLTNVGFADVYVAKLTDAGGTASFAWAQRAGGRGFDVATALTVSGTSLYASGYVQSTSAGFGTTVLSNPSPGTSLGFLASLTDPILTATTTGRTHTAAQLYPNPAHHTATLRLPVGPAAAPLTLTDALGRAVRRYPAPAGPETALDLGGLPAGLYLLRGAGPAQRLAVE